MSFEFLHNSKFPAKLWQNPASIEGEEQNVHVCSFLESIEHDFMKALMIDTDNKVGT